MPAAAGGGLRKGTCRGVSARSWLARQRQSVGVQPHRAVPRTDTPRHGPDPPPPRRRLRTPPQEAVARLRRRRFRRRSRGRRIRGSCRCRCRRGGRRDRGRAARGRLRRGRPGRLRNLRLLVLRGCGSRRRVGRPRGRGPRRSLDPRRVARRADRLARLRRLTLGLRRLRRRLRCVHAQLREAQPTRREHEPRRDEQGPAPPAAMRRGLPVPPARPTRAFGHRPVPTPASTPTSSTPHQLIDLFMVVAFIAAVNAFVPLGHSVILSLTPAQRIRRGATPRARQRAVEVPSARVAVVHDAGRLSSAPVTFLDPAVKVLYGHASPLVSKLSKPLCARPIDTPTTPSLLSRQHFERVPKSRTRRTELND
ncbi:hypothetical protein SPURM210S_07053 [Streptomyces purpurascens]